MVKLVERLRDRSYLLFDAQMNNPHLERFGSYIVKEKQYNTLLRAALKRKCSLF